MILNVSGRCDIPAFYSEWFMNRIKDGFVDVRNPFNNKIVSRIYFNNVDLIVFCSKNPRPIIKYLKEIKIPIEFQITLTPYKEDIEPMVPSKKEIIKDIKEISRIIGREHVTVRYDPIFLNKKYNVNYHIRAFEYLCNDLSLYINRIIISFIDLYKNVEKNKKELSIIPFKEEDYKLIGESFSTSAHKNNIIVHTCAERRNLKEYGFDFGECISVKYAYYLTGKMFNEWKARNNKYCHCAEMVDIGFYNCCNHLCKYCYANYNENLVKYNIKKHDVNSSLLIGHLEEDDVIIERK